MKYRLDNLLLYDKTCKVCCGEFLGRAHDRCCSDRCRSRLAKRQSKDRREYYRHYYATRREVLRARARERMRRLRELNPEAFIEKSRAYRAANREAVKVASLWGVSVRQARSMIEQGTFPA